MHNAGDSEERWFVLYHPHNGKQDPALHTAIPCQMDQKKYKKLQNVVHVTGTHEVIALRQVTLAVPSLLCNKGHVQATHHG